jgi:hypothetical protein
VAILLAIAALIASAVAATRRRRRGRLPARAMIVTPRRSTACFRDGAVRSVQTAELSMPPERLAALWTPANLENLARTYWAFLTRVTLGVIRVVYGPDERAVELLGRPLTLLRFDAPEYVLEADHGTVRWPIRDGLLVARAGRGSGFLALDVQRQPPDRLRIEVEVANFYPAIAAGFSMPVYRATQAFVHVLVTHAFLRSLATLRLEESRIGRLAGETAWPADTDQP